MVYLNTAKRYAYGQFPTTEPKFFDMSTSVAEVPQSAAYPNGVIPQANPCTNCPVNGGTGT